MQAPKTIGEAALIVLLEPDPKGKAALTMDFARSWKNGELEPAGGNPPPERPARPEKPQLLPPNKMPARSSGKSGRVALLHAIAHIELNAIDLAWDIIARFFDETLPRGFCDDWVSVAEDEARHFTMLSERLVQLGSAYGALPAHDGLWEAGESTSHDVLARLALVPMVLEARGLDTAPATAERLRKNGDNESAGVLETIADEEISHVAAGVRWFEHIAKKRNLEPVPHFRHLLGLHFRGELKPPFNHELRQGAGMAREYYDPPQRQPAR